MGVGGKCSPTMETNIAEIDEATGKEGGACHQRKAYLTKGKIK